MLIASPRGIALSSVALLDICRDRDRLAFRFSLDGSPFATSIWYEGTDLLALESRHGEEAMQRLYFHIAAFVANQYASLAPANIDFGAYSRFVDRPFVDLWQTIFRGVWAQWRYENDRPSYGGPAFDIVHAPSQAPIPLDASGPALLFSGGGKDSVVCQGMLRDAGIDYVTFACAHSVYGSMGRQQSLIDSVVDRGPTRAKYRAWLFDEFMDSPIAALRPEYGVRTLLAAETPLMVFASLPVVLAGGHRSVVLGHERSADFGNLVWDATGEEINHMWGKTLEAERVLNAYIAERLLRGFSLYSIIKPLSDVAILNLAANDLDAIAFAHSCSNAKPWCKRCTKCAYVWLSYQAYFPREFVDGLFGENLFGVPENRAIFRGIIGADAHKPFDCIGLPDEALLAMELCRRMGHRGVAIDDFVALAPPRDYARLAREFLTIDETRTSNIPVAIWSRLLPKLRADLAARSRHVAALLA
jgi:hypothetical protein